MKTVCLALFLLATTAYAAPTNMLRVLAIYSNCFDYVFSSVVTGSGDHPTLAFNHLGGRTVFVKVGEQLDDFAVQAFEQRTEQVFNPTINAYQKVNTGTVVLQKDSETIRLEKDKPLRQPGYLGFIAWLDTGATAYVRLGATLATAPESVVTAIDPTSLTILSQDGIVTASVATQGERDGLAALWQQRQKDEIRSRLSSVAQQNRAVQIDQQARMPDAPAPVRTPSRLVEVTFNPLQIVNVTQTRMPVAWAVVPVTRTVNGKQVAGLETMEFTIPMPQFDRIEYRGTVMTYAK